MNTPTYLNFMPKSSLIKWAYEALCVNEFEGLSLNPKGTNICLKPQNVDDIHLISK